MRIFQLYPAGAGFSNEVHDFEVNCHYVAAGGVRQAYYFANQEKWSAGPESPGGIVAIHTRCEDARELHDLWCGCLLSAGIGISHGDGERLLKAAMYRHLEQAHANGRRPHHRQPSIRNEDISTEGRKPSLLHGERSE